MAAAMISRFCWFLAVAEETGKEQEKEQEMKSATSPYDNDTTHRSIVNTTQGKRRGAHKTGIIIILWFLRQPGDRRRRRLEQVQCDGRRSGWRRAFPDSAVDKVESVRLT